MGFDPISIGVGLALAGGATAAMSAANKAPRPKPVNPPVMQTPLGSEGEIGKRRKRYPAAAQIFGDEDLRLGTAGKLGM